MGKNTKQVSISVDKEVWDDFINKIEVVEGKTYGKIGPTLTDLITQYYLSDSKGNFDTKKIQELNDELSSKSAHIDNLLAENKELTKENSTLSKDIKRIVNIRKVLIRLFCLKWKYVLHFVCP
jgi:hypothetical protein